MGEEGEATLEKSFMESFESGGGWNHRSLAAVTFGVEGGKRESKERRKKKEEERVGRTDIWTRTPASLAPYCVIRAPVRLVPFLPDVPPPRAS
jgi:hypothetical protein